MQDSTAGKKMWFSEESLKFTEEKAEAGRKNQSM
jgi:hypothetical protein